jgi:hypothetical protein
VYIVHNLKGRLFHPKLIAMSSNLNFLDRRVVFARVSVIQASKKLLKLVLTFTLMLIYSTAYAGGGIGYKGIKLNLNGTNNWYNVHAITWSYQGCGDYGSTFYNSGNSNWNSVNLGSYSTTASLQITGYAVVGWADNGDYVAGKLEYKVWKQGDVEPSSWTIINIGNYQSPTSGATQVVCSSGNDRVVGYNNGTTNFQPGAVGTYNFKLKAFGRVQYTGGGGGSFNPFDGTELTATFTIIATPSITSVSSSTPANSSTQIYKGATVTVNGATLGNITTIKLGGLSGTTITGASISSSQISFTVPDATSGGTIYLSDGTYTATSTESFTNLGFISTGSGNWSSPSTWLGGTAPAGNTPITISNSQVLTLDAPASVSSLTINPGGTFENSSNTLTISGAGTLTNNGTFTKGTGTVNFTGTGTVNGTIEFNDVTIAGGVNFGTSSTIYGTMTINSGGFVNTNAPSYASTSTLRYNTGGSYGRGSEWSSTSGAGYPNHVQISNSTTLNLGAGALGTSTARQIEGNLTIDALSVLSMNVSVMTATLTVKGNYINNGTTALSSSSGGDLVLEGNLTDNNIFDANGRAIFFRGSNTQTITSNSNPLDIDVMRVEKSGGEIQLLQNLLVDETGDPIQFAGTSSILNLNGYTATFGKNGTASAITMNGTSSIKGSSTSSIIILGSGSFGTIRFDQTTSGTTNLLQNLTINRTASGSITLGNALIVGETLTLTDGTLTLGANTLTMGSSASITRTAGAISGTPTFSGTVDMTYGSGGSAAITTGSELASTINNLTINTSGGVTIGGNTTVSGTLTLNSGKLNTGNNTIYVSNASPNAISGYDNSKYIVGNLKRAVQGNASARSYVFPVGADATNYQETSIDLPAGSGFSADLTASFTASAISTGISGLSVNGTSLTGALNGGFWTIAQSGTVLGTPSYTVTLKMKGYSNGLGTTDANRYAVIKRDNGSSPWQSVGTHSNSTQSESGSVVTAVRSGLTSFSDFTIAFGSNPLPVTFTSLTGTIRNGRANLNWNIADEHNVDRYEVEESANGRQFQTFTQVDAASRSNYQATDAQLHTGANYYRVKAVDIDGKFTYSKIIRLDNNLAVDNDIRVYPNPSRGELNLGMNIPAGNYQIRLINAMGQTVYQQPLTHEGGSRSMQLGLPKLSSGVYQVEVRGGVQKHVRTVRIE